MTDALEDFGERLFATARGEQPPAGARERMLQAVRADHHGTLARGRPGRVSVLFLGAAALAAGTLLLLRHHDAPTGISAEPASARVSGSASSFSAPVVQTPSAPPIQSAPPVESAPPRAVTPAPVRSAPASLADETSALELAESALAKGDAQSALKALDHYDRTLKGRELRDEATLLRIEALSRSGQKDAAAALAARFVAANPQSPLVDRARSFTSEGKP
jgi:hypothetical protein